ncbi:alpha/beta hydrolase [Rathayibacter soli]|uniref:alpha/beta hydrolase n=1 Tax=Rathayibacter soli TaxID=3144168 RepID=UPI0027E3C223|nr:alpha/beta hydrolase [Glaciibacter superstes]
MNDYQEFRVPAVGTEQTGAELAGGQWHSNASGVPLLAIHGITASHQSWRTLARALPDVRVVAPDLRGRGRSNRLPAPWGMRDHADDAARVLDALGIERAVVVGHSMGGFVAVRLADQHPDRIASVVLIDGGLPLAGPDASGPDAPAADATPTLEQAIALLGPAAQRLTMSYPSRDAYADFWRAHPAFGDWNDDIAAYIDYDLEPDGDTFRSSARLEAVATNIVQMGEGDGYAQAVAALSPPLEFLHSPRGLLNETPPLYPDDRLAELARLFPALRVHEVDDVNHYTILMSEHGVAQVRPVLQGRLDAANAV